MFSNLSVLSYCIYFVLEYPSFAGNPKILITSSEFCETITITVGFASPLK
jgi:hypothetical protein